MRLARDAIHALVKTARASSPQTVPTRADFVSSLTAAGVDAAKAEEMAVKVFDEVATKALPGAAAEPLAMHVFMRRAVHASHEALRPARPARPARA